jgi:GH15 family glucan-1,4-alpha-glucosidase
MPYQPIEDYGIIGNLRTAALIAKNGSLDWLCFPRFDSPSVFGAILDSEKGGFFRISAIDGEVSNKQLYWPDTNVLVTRFLSADGVGEIIDFMPMHAAPDQQENHGLIRQVKVVRGSLRFRLECRPAFNYALDSHRTVIEEGGARFHSHDLHLGLSSRIPLQRIDHGVFAEFTLHEGHSTAFWLYGLEERRRPLRKFSDPECDDLFRATVEYWRRWISQSTYRGRLREIVQRSALALKLLTYEPTGAIVASPTCSLPGSFDGDRNWDYRYTWIRDAAFTVYSLLRIGLVDEASQFVSFLDARCHEMKPNGSLQVMYGIDGRHKLTERTLDHLEGYRGLKPVRIGNAAYQQLQLDIYGELMDSLYLYNKHVTQISYDLWVHLRRLTNWVCANWRKKDAAIWEVRGGKRDFVYSKVMSWVAVDRALRLAQKRSFPAERLRWVGVRDEIYESIMRNGWNARRKAFVQSYKSDALDASTLLMPLVFFVAPNDPRMLQTIEAINKAPKDGGLVSDGLVFRYDVEETPDGLRGSEGTFNVCTFWLVEALTRASAHNPERLQEARLLFEQMLGYANHLGLYGEQTGHRGEIMGNFPLALTHFSLISAACNLDRYLDGGSSTSSGPISRTPD